MSRTIERVTRSEQETMDAAAALAGRLQPGDVITLDGPLGAGKTCFVRGLARGLGLDPHDVASPTFVLCHEYARAGAPTLIHIDAYRLAGEADFNSVGWEELLRQPGSIFAVEWPERIAGALNDVPQIAVEFEWIGPAERRLVFTADRDLAPRLEVFDERTKPTG